MAKIYKGAIELIGNTPLVEITNIEKELDLSAKVLAKVEYLNPGGSVIAEYPTEVTLQDEFGELKKYRSYKYGKTSVTIFRKG